MVSKIFRTNTVFYFFLDKEWTEGKMKKIYFLCFYPWSILSFSDQYMSKDLLAVISILNNCSIYKLLTVILTHADTHTQGHVISLSLVYWMPWRQWPLRAHDHDQKRQSHTPPTGPLTHNYFQHPLSLVLMRNSLPDVHRVNVISVDNLLNLLL